MNSIQITARCVLGSEPLLALFAEVPRLSGMYDMKQKFSSMKVGDTVKFKDGLYADEEGARYKVMEVNGNRA